MTIQEARKKVEDFENTNKIFRCPERRQKGTDTIQAERVIAGHNELVVKEMEELAVASYNKKQQEKHALCAMYIKMFAKKQGLEFEYWVGGDVGGVACFGDFFLNYDDVVLDVKSRRPIGMILDWYKDDIERHTKRKKKIKYRDYGV